MEGVGARLGRSSTRYVPTTVFTGPVRKWKKKWVHVTPTTNNNHSHRHHNTTPNNDSHLLFYKWTPITQSQNNNNSNGNGDVKNSAKDDDVVAVEEQPRRKFKYVPIAVLGEQSNESVELVEDESKPIETDPNAAESTSNVDSFDEKPDINDVPMEENQATDNNPPTRQDLNESTLDLSLGLNDGDCDNDSDSKTGQI